MFLITTSGIAVSDARIDRIAFEITQNRDDYSGVIYAEGQNFKETLGTISGFSKERTEQLCRAAIEMITISGVNNGLVKVIKCL